jgi:parvulin-like peptidyl-prolyl isomerase
VPTLVRVNGDAIDVALAVQFESLNESSLLPEAIRGLLVRQYAERNNIRNTDHELQLAADEFRYSRGLESADAFSQWMSEKHQNPTSLQDSLDLMLINNKVRNAVPDSDLRAYYAEHQLEFEKVDLYSIRVDTEDRAKELLSQIQEDGANFHVLAMEHSQDEDTRHAGGYAGRLARSQVTPTVEAAVFKTKPVAVVGPVKGDKGWNLFCVTAQYRPSFEEVRGEIQLTLFEQLLQKLRSEATVEYPVFDATAAES